MARSGRKTEKGLFRLAPLRHILIILSALVICLHLLTRNMKNVNGYLTERLILPAHRAMAKFFDALPFSFAEVVIGVSAAAAVIYIIAALVRLVTKPEKLKQLYRLIATLVCAGLFVYALFCVMWGVYYYADDFRTKSGIPCGEISAEDLKLVTQYFADMAGEYGRQVKRDANGVYCQDRDVILSRSNEVYKKAERLFPCLEGPEVHAKGIHFSILMSYTDYTGFFFPFTGEANVNIHYPPCTLAATVAHELAHQRGVAKEQEANFCAVLSSLLYGDPDYCYSACYLAYIYLGNALYKADYDSWYEIRTGLDDNMKADIAHNREYWQQFETPVQTVANDIYEEFLQSYSQDLGLQSYGACVDLLVNYYIGDARAYYDM
ncbi:MAG: DUF3810 domain-containing protein [Clostridia bacterium]|nr:DUF3810 domain-containing protein [Clostridia bacterium]